MLLKQVVKQQIEKMKGTIIIFMFILLVYSAGKKSVEGKTILQSEYQIKLLGFNGFKKTGISYTEDFTLRGPNRFHDGIYDIMVPYERVLLKKAYNSMALLIYSLMQQFL